MIDDILDDNNTFRYVNTEYIWIEDNLFEVNDRYDVKNISKDIIDAANPINDMTG